MKKMKVSEILSTASMQTVPKARNLGEVGWSGGYLVVRYKGRPQPYIYGPKVDVLEVSKILANPYPDSLLSKLIKKHNWQSYKVH